MSDADAKRSAAHASARSALRDRAMPQHTTAFHECGEAVKISLSYKSTVGVTRDGSGHAVMSVCTTAASSFRAQPWCAAYRLRGKVAQPCGPQHSPAEIDPKPHVFS